MTQKKEESEIDETTRRYTRDRERTDEQENEESETDEQIACPECGGNLVDTERGGTVCEDCGLVVGEDEIDFLEPLSYEEDRKKLSESILNSSLLRQQTHLIHCIKMRLHESRLSMNILTHRMVCQRRKRFLMSKRKIVKS